MNRYIWVIVIGVLLVAGTFGVIKYWVGTAAPGSQQGTFGSSGGDNVDNSNIALPGSNTTGATSTTSTQNFMSLQMQGGGTLRANNILQDPALKEDPYNKGHYYLGNYWDPSVPNAPVPQFTIEYIAGTQFFNIALLQEPIKTARLAAEQYLMQHLGINPAEMCRIRYTITTPVSVNQIYAGENFGFSYCPGASQLP